MAGRGNPFSRDYFTGYSSESSGPCNPISEEMNRDHLYPVYNEIVNDLRRHTRAYVKKIGGLSIIPKLPRREYKRKDRPMTEDSVLVGDWEELVETRLTGSCTTFESRRPRYPSQFSCSHSSWFTSSLST